MGPLGDLVARIEFQDDVTEKEADRHTRGLVRGLGRLDVDDVCMGEDAAETATGPAVRDGGLTAVAGLVFVSGVAVRQVLTPLVTVIGNWLEQSGQKSVTIEKDGARITVTGPVAPEDVQAYVRALDEPGVEERTGVLNVAGAGEGPEVRAPLEDGDER
ncbi:hypothetical protein [Nocardiopsis salina]|uniref:hypothetical protein n=1 Tax=Nocardiopsis salina TaxID=245836 RepID=UPI00034DA82E|nr:hypothetical protein [Nocardiopsis salina]